MTSSLHASGGLTLAPTTDPPLPEDLEPWILEDLEKDPTDLDLAKIACPHWFDGREADSLAILARLVRPSPGSLQRSAHSSSCHQITALNDRDSVVEMGWTPIESPEEPSSHGHAPDRQSAVSFKPDTLQLTCTS